jgi:DNA-binding MarR family transcriptional regulator
MKLEQELKLAQPLLSINHEFLLSILRTASLIQKRSDSFFSQFGITDAQFNILMVLKYNGGVQVSQQDLSARLVVHKSNVVGLLDRLESNGLLSRKSDARDRRLNQIVLTPKGKKLVERVEGAYFDEIDRLMSALSGEETRAAIAALDQLRVYVLKQQ